jgi:hypothetical protein
MARSPAVAARAPFAGTQPLIKPPPPTPPGIVIEFSPALPAQVTGDQPGTPLQVSVTAYIEYDTGETADVDAVSVEIATETGSTYSFSADKQPPVSGFGPGWVAACQLYSSGVVTVTATASSRGAQPPDTWPQARVQVSLQSETPDLQVSPLNDGQPLAVPDTGSSVPLACTAVPHWPRRVTWSCGTHQGDTKVDPAGLFRGAVWLDPTPLGPRAVTVTCQQLYRTPVRLEPVGAPNVQTISIDVLDGSPPHLSVSEPPAGKARLWDVAALPGGLPVAVSGTAYDVQSTMVKGSVQVALDGGPFQDASTTDGWANWTTSVLISLPGPHTIHVRASDGVFSGFAAKDVSIEVVEQFRATDLDERLAHRAYLDALLTFAGERIAVAAGKNVVPNDFENAFHQRFEALRQPLSQTNDQGNVPVNELRVVVEALRGMLQATGAAAADEQSYRAAAYSALLSAIGTSEVELQLARGADETARSSLASRLGLPDSDASGNSTIDQLLLGPSAVTEDALERLCGLRSTTADPLKQPGKATLLSWRESYLQGVWLAGDRAAATASERTFAVLVDPDLIGLDDIAGGAGSAIGQLWTRRRGHVDADLAGFGKLVSDTLHGGGKQSDAFTAVVSAAIPGVDIPGLDADRLDGTDIGPALAAIPLGRDGLEYLLTVWRLAQREAVNDDEWGAMFAVLAQVEKARRYPAWSQEEQSFSLSPTFFQKRAPGSPDPTLNPWLASAVARSDWLSVLRTRSAQLDQLGSGLAAGAADAEQQALPILRDVLAKAAAAALSLADDAPWLDVLSDMLQLDAAATGKLTTSHLEQAIATAQGAILSVRTNRFAPSHPAGSWALAIDPGTFDQEWAWMSDYQGWRAAMLAFRYPENQLNPATYPSTNFSPTGTSTAEKPFAVLLGTLREHPTLTAKQAQTLADEIYSKDARTAFPNASALNLKAGLDEAQLNALRAQTTAAAGQSWAREAYYLVPMLLGLRLQASGEYAAALDWFQTVYDYRRGADTGGGAGERAIYYGLTTETPAAPDLTTGAGWLLDLNPHDIAASRPNPYTRFAILTIARCCAQFADTQFTLDTPGSVLAAQDLYLTARSLLQLADLRPVKAAADQAEQEFDNPVRAALLDHVTNQLAKLRDGRDIAGMPRAVQLPDSSPSELIGPAPPSRPPAQYRYRVLADRARQLTQLAQQLEGEYLHSLEQGAAQAYTIFQANQKLDLAQANLTVQQKKVTEASDAITVAQDQKDRADVQVTHFSGLLAAGRTERETAMLTDIKTVGGLRASIGAIDAAIGASQALTEGASGAFFSFGTATGAAITTAVLQGVKGGFAVTEAAMEATQQADSFYATEERRNQEWQLQLATAQKDGIIAAAQVTMATDHAAVAQSEQDVAQKQLDHAQATVEFLQRQFTNVELYEWMSGVLGEQYAFVLQQATATARLAQSQLAFDRQEPALTTISTDYWTPPSDSAGNPASATDRRGLTGAERLLADLVALDEYALSSDRRRLNLVQTFSLAQRTGLAFSRFRSTGVLDFTTPMSWFDEDFPGHYLRQVKRVRTSVVALVPPTRGIRATLTASGISRVVLQADTFPTVTMRRDPERVALTSPASATGVFELDPQPELLLPFEEMGVDTTWRLAMPVAANPFDYASIADVLITIEYTALYDSDYEWRVLSQRAGQQRGGDVTLSVRRDYPDQWYELHNPPSATVPRTIALQVSAGDLPPNTGKAAVADIAVYLAPADPLKPASKVEVDLTHGNSGKPAGAVTDAGGVISTRRGNGASWQAISSADPPAPVTGKWTLGLQPDGGALVDQGAIDDIIVVLSYTAQAPPWPR